ncbi:MAG: 30S ribosomal protein S15 [Patescibacteria group bacterium]
MMNSELYLIQYSFKNLLKKEKKLKLIKEHGIHKKDTGSSDVQIALLSGEIDNLVSHLKDHPKDIHSKRGLVRMVVKRKKLLAYLKKEDEKRYKVVVKKLGLKK